MVFPLDIDLKNIVPHGFIDFFKNAFIWRIGFYNFYDLHSNAVAELAIVKNKHGFLLKYYLILLLL